MITKKKAEQLRELYKLKKFDRVNTMILEELELFNRIVYLTLNDKAESDIENFLSILFELLLKEDFTIHKYIKDYLQYLTLIENITRLSKHKTTQKILDRLRHTEGVETVKILLMMNLRTDLDLCLVDSLFSSDPVMGSYWLYSIFSRYSFCNDKVYLNIRRLQKKIRQYELVPFENMCAVYFNATYIDPENHLVIRKKINQAIKKNMDLSIVENKAGHNKVPEIGIVSKNWQNNKAVKKCIGSFIRGLKNDFNLSLVEIESNESFDPDHYFNRIFSVQNEEGFLNYTSIQKNDFDMIIFTDIGLNIESLVLANLRIAPIQIAMYGHPVSTASEEIDYFIVGDLSETSRIKEYYTEETLMISGTGMNSVAPGIKRPAFIEKQGSIDKQTLNIYVSSSLPKINPAVRRCWETILEKTDQDIVYHFLPGKAPMQEVSGLRLDLEQSLGKENIVVYRDLPYHDYMQVIKHCDIGMASYHYGDYNRIVESLWMGTPIIAVQGNCGYQNTGIGALKEVGLEELIADDLEDYVRKTLNLLKRRRLRTNLQRKVLETDIADRLINNKTSLEEFNSLIKKLLLSEYDRAGNMNIC